MSRHKQENLFQRPEVLFQAMKTKPFRPLSRSINLSKGSIIFILMFPYSPEKAQRQRICINQDGFDSERLGDDEENIRVAAAAMPIKSALVIMQSFNA